jgi:hypothetical protein
MKKITLSAIDDTINTECIGISQNLWNEANIRGKYEATY